MAPRPVVLLTAATLLAQPSAAFVPPSSSGLAQRCWRTRFGASDTPLAGAAHRSLPRRAAVVMMAKKKAGKGPAAQALAALEALEQQQGTGAAPTAVAWDDEEEKSAKPKKEKKDKKKPVKANAAAEAAMAMMEEEELGINGEASDVLLPPPEVEEEQKPAKKLKKGKGGDAAERVPEIVAETAAAPPLLDADAKQDAKLRREREDTAAAVAEPVMELVAEPARKPALAAVSIEAAEEEEEEMEEVDEGAEEDTDFEDPAGAAEGEEQLETLEERIRRTRPPPRIRISESAQPGYVSMRLEQVAVTFRNQEVVKDATWEVKTGDRVGLVGPNGGGKTTQVKILAGELEPTAGEVVKSSLDLRVAFLRQEFVDELVLTRPLKKEMLSVFKEENAVLEGLEDCEKELSDPEVQADADRLGACIDRLTSLQEEAERRRVYELDAKVQRVMDMMGFAPSDASMPVSSFSGGWRMRIGLGKILLQDPNILLLDEPTNHLDLESVEWLEDFLRNQNLPMVIVSHDREFLDRVCTKIVDTDGGVATTYDGNYSRFLKLKQARLEAWEASYQTQEKKIAEERSWMQKFRTKGALAAQVKSREARLEKLLASDEYIKRPPRPGKPFVFRFPPAPRVSEEGVVCEGVTHGYDGRVLFDAANLLVEKGQRVAFLGPNGAGKSTLLRLVMGREEPAAGNCRLGPGVIANYFEQNQADALDLNATVLETIESVSTTQSYNELRRLLGQFLFKGDDVQKKVGQLSGGEKARVALCKMMLTPANVLVLDEPTNHLDIPAKEMLEEALQHYDGAVLVVSHDRYFVSQVANVVCNIEEQRLVRYEGDYKYFLDRNDQLLDRVTNRYVDGIAGIRSAKQVVREEEKVKRNFGGKGGPSGRTTKGVKNAKRYEKA